MAMFSSFQGYPNFYLLFISEGVQFKNTDLASIDCKSESKALRVLLTQIGSRQTNLLLRCLVKWPTVEGRATFVRNYACMPAEW